MHRLSAVDSRSFWLAEKPSISIRTTACLIFRFRTDWLIIPIITAGNTDFGRISLHRRPKPKAIIRFFVWIVVKNIENYGNYLMVKTNGALLASIPLSKMMFGTTFNDFFDSSDWIISHLKLFACPKRGVGLFNSQEWQARSQWLVCHNFSNGHRLSINTNQILVSIWFSSHGSIN